MATLGRQRGRVLLSMADSGQAWPASGIEEEVQAADRRLGGDRGWRNRIVVLALPNGVAWLAAFLLCQRRGAIVLSVDPEVPPGTVAETARGLGAAGIWDAGGFRMLEIPARLYPDACLVKWTSDDAGNPAFLFFTDAEMLADTAAVLGAMGITAADKNFAAIPFGNSYGLGSLVLPLVCHAVPLAVGSGVLPSVLAGELRNSASTVAPLIPTLLRALLRAAAPFECLQSVRMVISAGAPLHAADARAFVSRFGINPLNFYGATQTGGISCDRDGRAAVSGRGVGHPLPGVKVGLTPEGRLRVVSPAVFTIGNHSMGAGDKCGAQVPGDFAAILPDGGIRLRGSLRSVVKVGGRRVNPAEVEQFLLGSGLVRAARIEAVEDSFRETRCTLNYSGAIQPAALRRALAGRFPPWKVPYRIRQDAP